MTLSDRDIYDFVHAKKIKISPFDLGAVQAASYDLHLAPYITYRQVRRIPETEGFPFEQIKYDWVTEKFAEDCRGELTYTLEPDEFALFSTIETVALSNEVGGDVKGKSSWAREGVIVESAGWVDPGFSGQLTLELKNIGNMPLTLVAGQAIAQIVFTELRTPALNGYEVKGRYQGQTGPTPARGPRT